MATHFENINRILTEWNPIGVPAYIASDEYRSYIPAILHSIESHEQLKNCLENMLNDIGTGYDPANPEHAEDLHKVCKSILKVYLENESTMKARDNIFGCYFQVGFDPGLSEKDFTHIADTFSYYIWGEKGICNTLKKLKHEHYGHDLKLALFQFYVKPTPIEVKRLKEIESYRKNERSIGIPIIVNDENFFSKSEEDRFSFLKQSVLKKMDLLAKAVKKKKLDTNMKQLQIDLQEILN